jgi:hypothetical protein
MTEQEPTQAQIARVYDYVLGGSHNYEVDRQAAARIMEVLPAYPSWAKMNRAFLGMVAKEWESQFCTDVLDLGSGLPSQGHFHTLLSAAILYTDSDPFCVEVGNKLLAAFPMAEYKLVDLQEPEQIIKAIDGFFDTRSIAIGFIGVMYLLPDEKVRQIAQLLHDWSDSGSTMAITTLSVDEAPEAAELRESLLERVRHMGLQPYFRTIEQAEALLAPWKIVKADRLERLLGQEQEPTSASDASKLFRMHGALLAHA